MIVKVLDLFCGAGGISIGFRDVGFSVTGVDISKAAGETFIENGIGKFILADLSAVTIDPAKYAVIAGGPPCRPWSSVNTVRRRANHKDYGLVAAFFRHVEIHKPRAFLLENVPPLKNDENLQLLLKRISSTYSIESKIIRYSDYGASTSRRRLIIFGIRGGNASAFFDLLKKFASNKTRTVKDAIWHLRNTNKLEHPDHTWPELKTIEKYRSKYEKGKFGWYKLEWNEPAPSFGNVMKTYILHPDSFNGGTTRVISVREALLIMGFDRSFHFPRSCGLAIRYQMVADSVSPEFSTAAARVILQLLKNNGHAGKCNKT